MAQGSRLDRWRSGGGEGTEAPLQESSAASESKYQQLVTDDVPASFDLAEPTEPRQYRAYNTQRAVPSLEIRRVLGAWHAPYYPFLMNVSRDANYGRNFVLFYSFMQVEVEGENLQKVCESIRSKRCVYIQDFHPEEYEQPEPGEPIITAIRVITKDNAEAMAETERTQTKAVSERRDD